MWIGILPRQLPRVCQDQFICYLLAVQVNILEQEAVKEYRSSIYIWDDITRDGEKNAR